MRHRALFVILVLFTITCASASAAEVLSLAEGISIAAEQGRLVNIARRDESIAQLDARVEKARMFPSVSTSFGGSVMAYEPRAIFGSQSVPISEKDYFTFSVSIQHTLFDFRANASRYESGMMLADSKRLDTIRIRNLVAVEFALIFFDLLESEKLESVAEKEVSRLESHLRDARNLYDEGVITRNDLLQAEVRLSDARQKLLGMKNLRAVNASRINNALRRPLQTPVSPEDPGDVRIPLAEIDFESAWGFAVQQRPEIQIIDALMKALDLEEKAKRTEYYPKVFARGAYDYTDNRYQVHQGNYSFTLGLGMNLFSGGSTTAELGKLEQQRLKMVEQRNKILDDIMLEVERYLLDSRTARERVGVSRDAVQQAEENLRINRVRYEEGVGTATEVLDAVTLLTVAETNYYKAIYDMKKSEAAVLYATGIDLLEVYR